MPVQIRFYTSCGQVTGYGACVLCLAKTQAIAIIIIIAEYY